MVECPSPSNLGGGWERRVNVCNGVARDGLNDCGRLPVVQHGRDGPPDCLVNEVTDHDIPMEEDVPLDDLVEESGQARRGH